MTAAVTLSNKDFPLLWTMWIQYETLYLDWKRGCNCSGRGEHRWTWWQWVSVDGRDGHRWVVVGICGRGWHQWTWWKWVGYWKRCSWPTWPGHVTRDWRNWQNEGEQQKSQNVHFSFNKKVLHTWSFCFWLLFRIWMHLRTEAPTKEWPRNSWQDKEIFSMDFSLSQIVWLFQGVASCQSSPPEFFEKICGIWEWKSLIQT